jgi:hypothetical protein
VRRWSELSRVERVGLYTRQSLYALLWSCNSFILLSASFELSDDGDAVWLVGGGLAVTALAFACVVPMLRGDRVLPWRRVVPLLVGAPPTPCWPEPRCRGRLAAARWSSSS